MFEPLSQQPYWGVLVAVSAAFYVVGFFAALNAIMNARTSQGAIAWAASLLAFPYVSLVLYLFFGRSKFNGYVNSRRAMREEITPLLNHLQECAAPVKEELQGRMRALTHLAALPATRGNQAQLLINGDQTFAEILAGIEMAKDYILVQYYIIRDDSIGQLFKEALIAKQKSGVSVYLLYDEIGCIDLPNRYLNELRASGATVSSFHSTKGRFNRFQINFRNHRKVVIVDGKLAFLGGLNLGDEYRGLDPKFGFWRDTHLKLEGPAVSCVQLSFTEDWNWAKEKVPQLFWRPGPVTANKNVLVLPTGPADELESCSLFYVHGIDSANDRVWISSPYFVPDMAVVAALKLAALRGVDVRIILPEKPDHLLVYLASLTYIEVLRPTSVKFYRYKKGFLHNKVMLVDDRMAAIGSANLDNRSFRLNFEITTAIFDSDFCKEMEAMLVDDLTQCQAVEADEFEKRPYLMRLAAKLANLLSPVL